MPGAWTYGRVVRELHYVLSMALALLLVFFASTGFMAQHREWFHARQDRLLLTDEVALGAPCDEAALRAAAAAEGQPGPVERAGDHLYVDVGTAARWACRVGSDGVQRGAVEAWPDGVPADVDAVEDWLDRVAGRRPERLDAPVALHPLLRSSTTWRVDTVEVDVARGRLVRWVRPVPVAYALIELHRGRGSTDVVVDVTAALAVLVSLTGILHALRVRARRRALLGALLAG